MDRNCKVITDSSASLIYGYYLSLLPSIELYVVHLIRDPRGFAYSCSQPKFQPDSKVPWSKIPALRGAFSAKVNPLRSAIFWMRKNLLVELVFSRKKGKYLRVHYEDFVENPFKILNEIGDMLGLKLEDKNVNFIEDKKVKLGEHHLTWGNVSAFEKGSGEIILKSDDRWKREMGLMKIILVTLITWPFLLKYFIRKW